MASKRKMLKKGQRFGAGIIIADMGRGKWNQFWWLLRCDCGNKYERTAGELSCGKRNACGLCKKWPRGKSHNAWRGHRNIPKSFFTQCKYTAKRLSNNWTKGKSIEFSITIEDISNQWEKQKGKCAYTGNELTFGVNWNNREHRNHKERTASMDRIDSSKGYVPGNIEFCHKHINMMKQSFEKEHFIKMCNLVTGGV